MGSSRSMQYRALNNSHSAMVWKTIAQIVARKGRTHSKHDEMMAFQEDKIKWLAQMHQQQQFLSQKILDRINVLEEQNNHVSSCYVCGFLKKFHS
uniref:Uncharacterized protein n=1 Tax=Ditylenchus dipsaci TaxID=166011 RepID=A0A915DUI0_9BILA